MTTIKEVLEKIKQVVAALVGHEPKDKAYSSRHDYPDAASAERAFTQSVDKLWNIDAWSNLSALTATFELHDSNGKRKKNAPPQVRDYIRIILPAPLPENWVVIIDLQSSDQEAQFTVSPSPHPQPQNPEEAKEVKHFFSSESTSTFRVRRQGNTIEAFEIGQNEKINNQGEQSGNRALVNTVIAEGGWAGMQAIQWKKLTDYLVHL